MHTFRTGPLLLPSERREEQQAEHDPEFFSLAHECSELSDMLHRALGMWRKICEERDFRKAHSQFWIIQSSYMAVALLMGSKIPYVITAQQISNRLTHFLAREELPPPRTFSNFTTEQLQKMERFASDYSWSIIFQINDVCRRNLEDAVDFFGNEDVPIRVNGFYATVESSLLEDYGVIPRSYRRQDSFCDRD